MSLILEALRKSEAERQRGRTPDLFAMPAREPVARAVTDRRVPAQWLAACAVLAIAVVVWILWPKGPASRPETQATTPAAAAASMPDDSDPLPAVHDQASAPSAVAAVAASAEPPPSPVPQAAPAALAPGNAARPMPTPAAAAGPASTAPTLSTRPAPPMPAVAPPRELASTLPDTPMPTPTTSPDGSMALGDLPTSDRQQLPPLKMSMHLWAPEAARRFVILDGNRLGEGDRVGNAVVESITADGAVIAWQGRRIRLQMR